jgi:formiminotetrahydrofolate cyclodeaminase
MITGWLKVAPGTALSIQLKVTAEEFAKTLAERIPTRPGAATAAVAAPTGAAQLAASAVAAALTALYLF